MRFINFISGTVYGSVIDLFGAKLEQQKRGDLEMQGSVLNDDEDKRPLTALRLCQVLTGSLESCIGYCQELTKMFERKVPFYETIEG